MAGWQVGDLALCVRMKPCSCCGHFGTAPGSVHRVTGVTIARQGYADAGQTGLYLAGVTPPHGRAFAAHDYRKITPGHDIEGIEEPRRLPVKEDA